MQLRDERVREGGKEEEKRRDTVVPRGPQSRRVVRVWGWEAAATFRRISPVVFPRDSEPDSRRSGSQGATALAGHGCRVLPSVPPAREGGRWKGSTHGNWLDKLTLGGRLLASACCSCANTGPRCKEERCSNNTDTGDVGKYVAARGLGGYLDRGWGTNGG